MAVSLKQQAQSKHPMDPADVYTLRLLAVLVCHPLFRRPNTVKANIIYNPTRPQSKENQGENTPVHTHVRLMKEPRKGPWLPQSSLRGRVGDLGDRQGAPNEFFEYGELMAYRLPAARLAERIGAATGERARWGERSHGPR